MQYQLKDMMDLDFLLALDDEREIKEGMDARLERDRQIHARIREASGNQVGDGSQGSGPERSGDPDGHALILAWLKDRRTAHDRDPDADLLPGSVYAALSGWTRLVLALAGVAAGFGLAGSFLVYHGTRPVNVTSFWVVFCGVPFLLSMLSLAAAGIHLSGRTGPSGRGLLRVFQSLVQYLCFSLLPALASKLPGRPFRQGKEALEAAVWQIRTRQSFYRPLFFFPFFIQTSLFGAAFSLGALGAVFFKVLASDIAFGWQSTLVTSGRTVYDLVSIISLPWQMFTQAPCPGLEQIQGSRIILKQGISVLATRDLVSWWPFICWSIFIYGIVPRLGLMAAGAVFERGRLRTAFSGRPEYARLRLRMTAPGLRVDPPREPEAPVSAVPPQAVPSVPEPVVPEDRTAGADPVEAGPALLLAPVPVYGEKTLDALAGKVLAGLGAGKGTVVDFRLNRPGSAEGLDSQMLAGVSAVVLVQEAWQPPIRGLLHSLGQLKKALPPAASFWLLLTRDAGGADLFLEPEDGHVMTWQAAVQTLGDAGIRVLPHVRPGAKEPLQEAPHDS